MHRIFLICVGIIVLGFGVVCAVAPGVLLDAASISTSSVTGMVELRAYYGGLEIGLGVFFLLCAFNVFPIRVGLMLCLLVFGCVLTVRVISAVGLSDSSTWTMTAIGLETVVTALSVMMVRQGSR